MKRNAIILITLGAVLVLAVVLRFAMGKADAPVSIEDIQKTEGVPVQILTLQPTTFERWRTFSGTIEGKSQAILYSNIPARVRKVHYTQGDTIQKGRTVVSLDPLSSAQSYSALNVARIQTEDAKRLYNRMRPLFEAGAISKEEFDQVKSALAMANAGYTDVTYTTSLKSPITGTLTDLRVNPGTKIEPGETVAVVADITGAKLIVNVSQSDVEDLKVGQPVVIGNEKSKRAQENFSGKIARISISADMTTRLFRVEVDFDANEQVRPGTLRYGQVRTDQIQNALILPIEAATVSESGTYVFVVNDKGHSEKRPVTIGANNEDAAVILSGLSAGDSVVVWGHNRLSGGEKLKIVTSNDNENENPNPAKADS